MYPNDHTDKCLVCSVLVIINYQSVALELSNDKITIILRLFF